MVTYMYAHAYVISFVVFAPVGIIMDVPDLQKRIVYNDLLPYAPLLESLAKRQFEEIKWNLSVAIQKYELWPGALYWTNRLNRYLNYNKSGVEWLRFLCPCTLL